MFFFCAEVIGRTFGRIKRMQTALIPIVYKLGIISAVILMTFFLAFKGVFIGTLILILNITFFALKIGTYLKSDHSHAHSLNSWQPPKDIHLHIHNAQGQADYTGAYNTIDTSTQYWNTPTTYDNTRKRENLGRDLFFGESKWNATRYTRPTHSKKHRTKNHYSIRENNNA